MPSTFFNVGSGAKAAYDVLDQLEYPRHAPAPPHFGRVAPGKSASSSSCGPTMGLAREEVAALEDWIEEGHALVVVPGSASESLMTSVAQARTTTPFWTIGSSGRGAGQADGSKPAHFQPVERAAPLRKVEAGDGLTAGITELAVPDEGRRFDPKSPCRRSTLQDASARVFWKDPQGTIGLQVESGDGTIIALADEYPLTNLGISEGDNGLLLANVVRDMSARYPGQVAFDEFHLGLAEHDVSPLAIVKLMLSGPWRWAAVQAALVGVLALFARAVRFGSPQDVVRKPRRQHREFAEAAGRLFDEAGATSLAAETLYRYYRERICKLLLFDPKSKIGNSARRSSAVPVRPSPPNCGRRKRPCKASLSRQKLLAISQKLHRVAEALDHGT